MNSQTLDLFAEGGAVDESYVVPIYFDNKTDAKEFVEWLEYATKDPSVFKGSYSSEPEPYYPWHYLRDFLEIRCLIVAGIVRRVYGWLRELAWEVWHGWRT
jgi:hypothetical protein